MSTCASCKHIGEAYWGHHSDYGGKTHFCGMSGVRRRDQMKPTGDFSEDFMQNFRTFFDANALQASCKYYEAREPLAAPQLDILRSLEKSGGKAAYGFFSEENILCEKMGGRFVERDEWAARQRKPTDGTRDWRLTKVGEVEAKRGVAQSGATPTAHQGTDAMQGGDRNG